MTSARLSKKSISQPIKYLGDKLIENLNIHEQIWIIKDFFKNNFNTEVIIWLDETLFRLPGMDTQQSGIPSLHEIQKNFNINANQTCYADKDKHSITIILTARDISLGYILLRDVNQGINQQFLDEIEIIAHYISLGLIASHRAAVEKLRLDQLTLVRVVSSQLAKVHDLYDLARQITKLMLDTFNLYYVAIFVIIPGQKRLKFWSSAGPGNKKNSSRLFRNIKVEFGQGLIGQAALAEDEILVNDVSLEPKFREVGLLPETKSEVVLPLKIGENLLGVMDIQSNKTNGFHQNDLLVFRTLADNIAISVNNSQLYSELVSRANHLSIVAEVSKEITSILDLNELLTRVALIIHERLKFPHVYVYTVHTNRGQIIFQAGSGQWAQSLSGYSINIDSPVGIIPWVTRNSQTICANNVLEEPHYSPSPFPPENTKSELTIPLLFDNKPLGVLDIQSDRKNAFSPEDKEILEALADTIAVAINNAGLFRTERWRRQVADSLREVTGLISGDMGVDEVIDSVLRELQHNLPCEVAAAWLLEGDELYLAHIHGSDLGETEEARKSWPESDKVLVEILNSSLPVIRKPADPFEPTGIARGFSADYSSISIAMRVGERALGLLTLSHHTPGRYGHEAEAVISTFANYSAVAIENARLFDSAQEQAYASAALLQVAQTVTDSSNLHETIESIVRISPILVGVKACAIYLWENDHFQPWAGYGYPDAVEQKICKKGFTPGEFPLLDKVYTQRKVSVGILAMDLPEYWLDPELAQNEQEVNYAIQTSENLLIGFPISIRNECYGILLIHEAADDRKFRQKRLEILNGIAQQIAMSVQNDQLQHEMMIRERLEHEVQLARQIQQAFLPERLPELMDWELSAKWKPAREVGGDFYDVFELPGRKLGLLIADVSDKGIPAALFMALTRTVIRASVVDTDSPALVMKRVNQLIVHDNREGMFVTAIYGVVDLDTGYITYANAGHNPPAKVLASSRECEFLQRTGPAVGIIDDFEIQERSFILYRGDSLLLYTDGLTEAFSQNGQIFGLENIQKVINRRSYSSTKKLLDSLEARLDKFTSHAQLADDLTMLAIHRKTEAEKPHGIIQPSKKQ